LTIFADYHRLSEWEEAIGVLHEVQRSDGFLIAKIGPARLALPEEMAENLNCERGRKIGILRTDKDFRFRVL
jgi:hypothetical protein